MDERMMELTDKVIRELVLATVVEGHHASALTTIGTILAGYCEITNLDKYEVLADLKKAYEEADALGIGATTERKEFSS